jgi:ubiquinone/menaquinone biosynthesis C-methylase UbiE
MSDEIARIRQVYDARYRPEPGDYAYMWHARNPIAYTYRQARERAIIEMLNRHNLQLEDLKALDVGCGSGDLVRFFASLGAAPQNLYGVDLMEHRIENARELCPSATRLSVEDAQHLSFQVHTFDLVSQFTVFSSILDPDLQRNVAGEMNRVLKPAGMILWYDLRNHFPAKSNVQGINQTHMIELFPGYVLLERRLLHHRWISRLAGRSWLLCELIERLPGLLHTHILALLKKQ